MGVKEEVVLREDLVWAPSIHRQNLSAPNMTFLRQDNVIEPEFPKMKGFGRGLWE